VSPRFLKLFKPS